MALYPVLLDNYISWVYRKQVFIPILTTPGVTALACWWMSSGVGSYPSVVLDVGSEGLWVRRLSIFGFIWFKNDFVPLHPGGR